MKVYRFAAVLLLLLPLGCASFSGKARMDRFVIVFDAYESAMRTSNFSAVCGFVDPKAMPRQECLERFGNIKIVEYRLSHLNVPEDRMSVEQEIDLQYYRQNAIVLKAHHYAQVWTYQEDTDKWMLKDGPPVF